MEPGDGTARQIDGPRQVMVRMGPGIVLDELMLNLFPLVEAGVIELVIGPDESAGAPIVFEECGSRPDGRDGAIRRAKVRVVEGTRRPPESEQCLAPAGELVPWVHAWLRHSVGLDTA